MYMSNTGAPWIRRWPRDNSRGPFRCPNCNHTWIGRIFWPDLRERCEKCGTLVYPSFTSGQYNSSISLVAERNIM